MFPSRTHSCGEKLEHNYMEQRIEVGFDEPQVSQVAII